MGWVADFLTDRFQRVKLSNHYYSEWARVSAGVPQGTKLGSWFFLLMINDLKVKDAPIAGNSLTIQLSQKSCPEIP